MDFKRNPKKKLPQV